MTARPVSRGALLRPRALLQLALASLLAGVAHAQVVTLERIAPRGAQRGTSVELSLAGKALSGAENLVFDRAGMSASEVRTDDKGRVRARLAIAADAPLGPHAIRVRTLRGLSGPLVFHVGPLPVIAEAEPNADTASAQAIQLGCTVEGKVSGEDEDVFAVPVLAGTKVRAVVEAVRLGGAGFDPMLELLDASGTVLARGDDSALTRRDSVVQATIAEGEICYVRVRDAALRARRDAPYRLHVDAGPQPLATSDLAVPSAPGLASAPRMLLGPGGPLASATPWARELEFATGAAPAGAVTWWPEASLAPLVLRASSLPTRREVEPNDKARAPQELGSPGADGIAVEGVFARPGDRDRYSVELEKGERIEAVVWARRLRSPVDATLSSTGPDGKFIRAADDSVGVDPVLSITAKQKGKHTIIVSELLGRGGPAHVYRLEITRRTTAVSVGVPGASKQVAVPRGRRATMRFSLERQNLSAPLALDLEGLPAGVTARPTRESTGGDSMIVLFEAADDAPLGVSGATARAHQPGKGDEGASGGLREVLTLVEGPNNTVIEGHLQTRLPVAVIESVPFDVIAEPAPAPLVRGGEQLVRVRIERDAGFTAPVTVGVAVLPGGVRTEGSKRLEGDTLEATFRLEAAGDAAVGESSWIAFAESAIEGAGVRIATAPAAVVVAEPVLALEAKRGIVERESEGTLAVSLKRRDGAPEGDVEVRLVGLPHDVASEVMTLAAGAEDLIFPLRIGPKAPTGNHRGLALKARVAAGEGEIVQTLGGIELRVQRKAAPPKAAKPVVASASRLEKLRAEHAARVDGERAPPAEEQSAPAPGEPASDAPAGAAPAGEGAAMDTAAKDAPKESGASEAGAKDAAKEAGAAGAGTGGEPEAKGAEPGSSDGAPPAAEPAKDPPTGSGGQAADGTAMLRRPRAQLAASAGDEAPSFLNDVVPILTASGCNAGACHGASRGQDGFHLSLFGYDAAGDHGRLLRERLGRRLDLAFPAESLLLTKATGAVPHTGGKLIEPGSVDHEVILRWIEAGAPSDVDTAPRVVGLTLEPTALVLAPGEEAKLSAMARYADGTVRDVTRLALVRTNDASVATLDRSGAVRTGSAGEAFLTAAFATETVGAQVIVRSTPADAPWSDPAEGAAPATWIDELIAEKLRAVGQQPAPLCSDGDFLRRVSLDLVGLPPTPEELRAFEQDARPSPEKRAALVDGLVARPEFLDQWVMRFAEVLLVRSTREISPKSAQAWYRWLRAQLHAGVGIDELMRAQLTAKGDSFSDAEASYFLVERDPKVIAENVAQAMLGVRISCAQCHNHPFDRWTQDDYAGFVAFFSEVRSKRAEDPDERTVYDRRGADFRHPTTNAVVRPKFLGGAAPDVGRRLRRDVLAEWLASPENPWFARNIANRVWAAYMGRGVVEPVDDVRVTNPPSSEPLLAALGARLAGSGFDLRDLAREIVLSRAYQRTSDARLPSGDAVGDWDRRNFAAFQVRRLRAETLSDSLAAVTGVVEDLPRLAPGVRATELGDGADASYFLRVFGRAPRETSCACEVSDAPSLSQALHLVNGATVHAKVARGGVVKALIDAGLDDAAAVDALYERALCRAPVDAERAAVLEVLAEAGDARKAALEDVFWALLTSNEFLFQR